MVRGLLLLGSLLLPVAVSAQPPPSPDAYAGPRRQMVDRQLRRRGIRQPALLQAMSSVPRHLFVPDAVRDAAYDDGSLPIGGNEDGLLQPYISALMIELLQLDGSQKVLEVGTGSGYDAAILSRLAKSVHTMEISEELAQQARRRLRSLGYDNVFVHVGDGWEGWESEAPFDAILLTAAPPEVPQKLLDQLALDGRMVLAVGDKFQELILIQKTPDEIVRRKIEPVRIGAMSGNLE